MEGQTSEVLPEVLPVPDILPEVLTVPQAANELGKTRAWVNSLIRQKRLPAVLILHPRGNYYQIARADLDQARGLKKTGRPSKKGALGDASSDASSTDISSSDISSDG